MGFEHIDSFELESHMVGVVIEVEESYEFEFWHSTCIKTSTHHWEKSHILQSTHISKKSIGVEDENYGIAIEAK